MVVAHVEKVLDEDDMSRRSSDPPIHRIDLRTISEDTAKKLIQEHRGMVLQFAKKYLPRQRVIYWIEIEDLIAIGESAVLEAAASYNEDRGTKQSTWIGHIIKRRMLEAVRRARGQTRAQNWTAVRLYMLKEGWPSTEKDSFQAPTPKEIQNLEDVRKVRTVSLDRHEDEEFSLLDRLTVNEDAAIYEKIEKEKLLEWLRSTMRRLLTQGERQALLAFSDDETGPDTATQLGVSRQRIAQLRNHALRKLRHAAIKMGWGDLFNVRVVASSNAPKIDEEE